jgi:hypothetical protein
MHTLDPEIRKLMYIVIFITKMPNNKQAYVGASLKRALSMDRANLELLAKGKHFR